ncbi:MAG: tRNA guanosine(34) transglycosylase Tgt [Candidatus Nomurabacteria bacterium]|nr:tRNA guanosine(34) transglycosylase Tgt [Candidatus Nomurabacteria bacterium]
MKKFNFKIEKKIPDFLGRAGVLSTPHGDILTPSFVPVGTKATVKAMTPEMLVDLGAQVVLANTYHLYLQPGDDLIAEAGGLGRFMNWHGPTMTDSGGFQVFSLGAAYGKEISKVVKPADPSVQIPERSSADDGVPRLATIGNDGVSFRSHIDGSFHYITPEKSIQIQQNLGADIIFAFDECTSPAETDRYQEEALSRTHAWAKRSLDEHKKKEDEKNLNSPLEEYPQGEVDESYPPRILSTKSTPQEGNKLPQALFGIVQGGRSEKLRKQSADIIGAMDFNGFGIGGSFAKEDMSTAVKWVNEVLPEEKPRHLLGIGEPEDLFMGVENGVDLFDCVAPTRIARNGTLYTKNGKINMMNAKFVKDFTPVEEGCACYTCANYTRAYVSHLYRSKEMLAGTLGSIHNVYFINKLVMDMRNAILNDTFFTFKEDFLKEYLK